MSIKLFIGKLAGEIPQGQFGELFSTVGTVKRATGTSIGFPFIEMTSVEATDAAIEKFHGSALQGKTQNNDSE